MLFNDLLAKENMDPGGVLVVRHTPKEAKLKEVLPWLAGKKPDTFNAYQQTQGVMVEADFLKARYVASFIGLEKRKGSAEDAAVFVGLYKVGDHRSLTHEDFWTIPAFQQMKNEYDMIGFVEGERPSCLWFDLKITDFYERWRGKLVIEWPRPAIRWWRWLSQNKFPIDAILENSLLDDPPMPDWKDCILSCARLGVLPNRWAETLRGWRGIYYIHDASDGKGYVGAAYGKDNILGRWERHAAVGGDSVYLRQRSAENFQFSILQRLSPDAEKDDVEALETTWKNRLHTRGPFGLNDN